MEVVDNIEKGLDALGFNERNGRTGFRAWLFLVTKCVMTINMTFLLIDRWTDIDERIFILKAFSFMMLFFMYCVPYVFHWTEQSPMIGLLQDINLKIPYKSFKQRNNIIASMISNMNRFGRLWMPLIRLYFFGLAIVPALSVLINILWFSEDLQKAIKQNHTTPFPLYYPEFLKLFNKHEPLLNVVVYVVAYFFQFIYSGDIVNYSFVANVSCMCASMIVESDLKLLRLSLSKMEDILRDQNDADKITDEELKKFVRYFVLHQQEIYRKCRMVDDGVKRFALGINVIASIYICMALYTVIQKDSMFSTIEEFVYITTWGADCFLYNLIGEKINTEHENLRKAFYECSWTDKPKWFKNSLLIAMTRSSKPIDLKPFGLFSLKFSTFLSAMNAAYSYFNLLNKFKNG